MSKIINGSSLALALANYLCTNAYLNDTAQDVLIMVGNWIDEAQEITVPKWIPVSERLPEDNRQVLACTKKGKAFSAHYDYIWKSWSVSHTVKITHWMPLPDAPKEDN